MNSFVMFVNMSVLDISSSFICFSMRLDILSNTSFSISQACEPNDTLIIALSIFSLGKNGNRKITGSINEMKRMTVGLYSPEQINAMEMAINQCLFSYLSADKNDYSTPFEAVETYVKGETPWLYRDRE